MPHIRVSAAVALIVGLSLHSGSAQQPAPQRAPGTLQEGVTAVLVDVVVRDRRGQPVRDLTPADFEILEDGVVQTIGSFTPSFETAAGAAANAAPSPDPAATAASNPAAPANNGPAVVALVFDRLSPEGRRLAVQAAQSYLGTKEQTPDYIGVFGIDLALTPYSPFTRNAVVLRKTLASIAERASASFNRAESQEQKSNADRQARMAGAAAASAEAAGGPGASAAMGSAPGEAQLAQMQSRMIETFDGMARDQEGYATTDGLFAIVNTLGRLPGRKSLVLFSEGIAIPPAVHRLFLGVIDAANRANVSIYTMDAAGLRAHSDQAKIRDEVNAAASAGINTAYAIDGGGSPLTRGLEANESNLRSDPAFGLGQLAQDTGGLVFRNTNNLRPAFERIESDLRNYYLLGYTPANNTFDGRFRTIEVKVKRSGVTVAARKGYFAVRNPGGGLVNPWEAAALVALERKPVPNAFPIRASALLFPERGRPGLVPVVVDLKTAPLTFSPTSDGKEYASDFTVLVRFLDGQSQVVRKVSQHYEVRGPIGELERAKQGDVIFYREPELAAGVYTMETVVHDAPSGRSSVRYSTVEVVKHEEASLRMSSLVLVRRGDRVPEKERRADNPLLVNDLVISPNLGEPVSRASKEVGFYFVIYPATGGAAPDATIQLELDGKPVAQLPMPVRPADASGRIQQLGRLPIGQLTPGTYELRAIVKQGNAQIGRSTMVRIVE
jgi:VWFA-related protein